MLISVSPGLGACRVRGSLATTLAPDERASLAVRTQEPQFGAWAGVGGVRRLLVYSQRLECVFLELRGKSLVVASQGGVLWRREV